MKFISILLKEGRKEDLNKKYSNKFGEETLNRILNISDLVDFNHKYTDWILKTLNPDSDDLDIDVEIAVQLVKDFNKFQPNLEKKDINQYNGFEELDTALFPLKIKEKEKEWEKQVDRIYEDDKFLVIRPKTHQASCKYGANTKWCTTSQDTQHFERYTSGNQGLYYIINKTNSTNKSYSKVAIHFDSGGYEKYWDSADSPMSDREIDIFNYAFPEIIGAIRNHYQTTIQSAKDEFFNKVFNGYGISDKEIKKFLGTPSVLKVRVGGFETIDDLGPGHANGNVEIILNDILVDSYALFMTYKALNEKTLETSIGFMGNDEPENGEPFLDLGLENWGFGAKYHVEGVPQKVREAIRNLIASRVLDYVKGKPELTEKVVGTAKVFTPTYGYTFGKNKGWIKKLVDYLDSGKIGTKLDFLLDTGYIERVMQDGELKFRKTKGGFLYSPRDLRGQHASFFAAAKNAGILDYRKQGKDFFLIKGPNFEAFKSGELKAL